MNTIEEGFKTYKDTPSNINEHIPVLAEYAEKVLLVTSLVHQQGPAALAVLDARTVKAEQRKIVSPA